MARLFKPWLRYSVDRLYTSFCVAYCVAMATNLLIDDKLVLQAQKLGGHKTKRAAVNDALAEYVRRRQQMKVFEIAGTIDYDPKYDYKKQRSRR